LERLANYDNKDAWRLKNKNLEKNGKKPGTGSGEQGA
jgi:hypothetical protein